jgi:hypothetical protein
MLTVFQKSAFQNDAFQNNVFEIDAPVVTNVVVGGGIPKRRYLDYNRRRWVLPNGDNVFGTYDDIVSLLQTAIVPKKEQNKKKQVRAKITKDFVDELVVFKPLNIAGEKVVKINLSDLGAWKPDRKAYMDALIAIEDEDRVVQLLLMN